MGSLRKLAALAAFGIVACGGGGRAVAPNATPQVSRAPADVAACEGASPLANGGARPRQVLQSAHLDEILGLAVAPRTNLMATIGRDQSVRIWDSRSMMMIREMRRGGVGGLAFDAAGTRLAFETEEYGVGVDLFDLAGSRVDGMSGSRLFPVAGKDRWLAYSRTFDGAYLTWRDLDACKSDDIEKPKDTDIGVSRDAPAVTVSPDGRFAAAAFTGKAGAGGARASSVVVWSTSDEKKIASFASAEVSALALNDRGELAVASADGIAVRSDKGVVRSIASDTFADRIALASDGSTVVAFGHRASAKPTSFDGLVAWDVATQKLLWRAASPHMRPRPVARGLGGSGEGIGLGHGGFESPPTGFREMAFTTDGRAILAGFEDGSTRTYDVASGRVLRELGTRLRRPLMLARVDDETITAVAQGHVTSWSLRGASVTSSAAVEGASLGVESRGAVSIVTRIPDKKKCADGDALALASRPAIDLGCIATNGYPLDVDVDRGRALIDAGAGNTWSLAVRSAGGAVVALEKPKLTPGPGSGGLGLRASEPRAYEARFAAGGRVVAVVPEAGAIVWSADDGKIVRAFVTKRGTATASTTRATPAKSAACEAVRSVGTAKGNLFNTFEDPPDAAHASISRDGARIAVEYAGGVEIFDVATGRSLSRTSVSVDVTALAILDDGFVVSGADGSLVVNRKDVRSGTSDGGKIVSLRVGVGERIAATLSEDGAVRVWDLARGEVRAALAEFEDDEWIAFTPGGAYVGTSEVAERVGWMFDAPFEAFRFEQFSRDFGNAALVKKRLAGDAVDVSARVSRPPSIVIADAPRAPVDAAVAKLSIVASADGRVDAVRAYSEGRQVAARAVCAKQQTIELEIPLLPGTNRISVEAFDASGAASNPAIIDVVSRAPARRPKLWLVAVGVDDYRSLGKGYNLDYATSDARAIAARFGALAGPDKPYASVEPLVLLDAQVDVASVRRALEGLAAMKPEDVAVVFFAGHGMKPTDDADMVFVTGRAKLTRESIAANGIGWREIGDLVSRAKGRVLVLLDACHSGHLTQDLVVQNELLAHSLVRDGRAGAVVFAASKGRQLSYEPRGARGLVLTEEKRASVQTSDAEHGFFTGALLQSMDDRSTDRDGDGVIQLSELLDAVTVRVTTATEGKQTPWVARREMFGDFGVATIAPPRN